MTTRWEDFAGDDGLRAMCDFGASEVAAGRADVVSFSIMGSEADFVREYMADKHPSTPYSMNWPTGLPLHSSPPPR